MPRHFVIAATLCLVAVGKVAAGEAGVADPAVMPERHRMLLENHCRKCHSGDAPESGFRVDDLPLVIDDVGVADRWQQVLGVLNAGEMPPEDEPQPDPEAKTDFLDDLSNAMVAARRRLADQHGVITMRRLNRREYRNTIRALLDVEIDVSDLPADTGPDGFDTLGANLFMSSNQFELYLDLGRRAVERALARLATRGTEIRHRIEPEGSLANLESRAASYVEAADRFRNWAAAVKTAGERPENATVVAELIKNSKRGTRPEVAVRAGWSRIAGASSPEKFGFTHPKGPAHAVSVAELAGDNGVVPYLKTYLALKGLDRGAYLTACGGPQWNSMMQFEIQGHWPSGDYVFRFRVAAAEGSSFSERFIEFCGSPAGRPVPLSVHEVTGTLDSPQVIEVPVSWSQGQPRKFFICHRGTQRADRGNEITFRKNYETQGKLPEIAIWVDWTEVEYRSPSADSLPPGLAAFAELPLSAKSPPPAVEAVRTTLERFALEAFRGTPPPDGMIDKLLALYEADVADGRTPVEAVAESAAILLASPPFLYLAEPLADASRRQLTGRELAVRLSYFLWGQPPDPRLRELGASGKLLDPEVLSAEVDRLLDDPRSTGFVRPFLHQWLGLDRLDFFDVNQRSFPRYDAVVDSAVREEIYQTVEYLVRNNGSLADLLDADYVIANGALADYYGLEGLRGDEFRKVPVPEDSPRGGLLGMAAVYVMGGNGEVTNPVERGVWVLRKLVNDPPPPAPPNVPAIGRLADKVLTTRERLAAHQEAPQCASCHRKIDPIGLGLENFDAAGTWRTKDSYQLMVGDRPHPNPKFKKTWTIEPAGAFHKGPTFADYFELRRLIASRSEPFARGFTVALVEYALGRPCGFSDEPLVESILARTAKDNFAIRDVLHALVASEAFRTK